MTQPVDPPAETPVAAPIISAPEISTESITAGELYATSVLDAWEEWVERQTKWDWRFIDVAELVSSWSKDPSTKCGAVIVRPDNTIVSTGYNGFPRGCSDADEVYADRDLKLARVVHAEVNAILHAPEPVAGYTLYSWPPNIGPSCDRCTAHIIQAGISRVVHVWNDDNEFVSRWTDSIQRGLDMYQEAGVTVDVLQPEDRPSD